MYHIKPLQWAIVYVILKTILNKNVIPIFYNKKNLTENNLKLIERKISSKSVENQLLTFCF